MSTTTSTLRLADLCLTDGHDLAADGWRLCACGRSLPNHADALPDPAGGDGCGMTWRVCGRCEHIDEHHITEHRDDQHDQHDQRQPGGYLRQDVSAGPALPNHHQAAGETAMVEPSTAGGGRR
jgi:hypothetical protein